jgi:predicted TIM-barrel fold metal-dependent hydrolase
MAGSTALMFAEEAAMSIFDEPKIDCHAHIFDPVRFPYGGAIRFHPSGQELGTAAQLKHVMQTYGVRHALLVQPNSGYGPDNSYLLDTIARGNGLFKGVAIIPFDADLAMLREFKRAGIVGAAINPTFDGLDFYKNASGLFARLAELDMFAQIQVERDQLLAFLPWIEDIPVKVLIDHCGRPTVDEGLDQPGFKALLRLAHTGRVSVKLSGYAKFSRRSYPFEDTWTYVRTIVDAFSPSQCVWATDWPFLRAPERQDYGPLARLLDMVVPDPAHRRAIVWETPARLFGFGARASAD